MLSFTAADRLEVPLGLAHDAGNLLNALGLYCDLLERPEVLRAEHRHYAVELRGIARRSAELVERLAVMPQRTSADAAAFAEMAPFESILRQMVGDHCDFDLQVETSLSDSPVPVEVVERILLNLVRNAAEAMEGPGARRGEIHASLRAAAGGLALTVEDNGPGVELETALRFLRPTAEVVPGARGLGHRILRKLARESGASFAVTARAGRGSRFEFCWKVGVEGTC